MKYLHCRVLNSLLRRVDFLLKKKWTTNRYPPYVEQPKDYSASLIKFLSNEYSQGGEDGILKEIFKRLNIQEGFGCEFGAGDGKKYSNTFSLIEKSNWKCIMIEADEEKYLDLLKTAEQFPNIIPVHETVHYIEGKGKRLESILNEKDIPKELELLSIDVDSCDYHIWKSFSGYKPKVVVIEHSGLDADIIQREGAVHKVHIDGSTAFRSMKSLGESKGYTLLCDTGNMIFIRDDLLKHIVS